MKWSKKQPIVPNFPSFPSSLTYFYFFYVKINFHHFFKLKNLACTAQLRHVIHMKKKLFSGSIRSQDIVGGPRQLPFICPKRWITKCGKLLKIPLPIVADQIPSKACWRTCFQMHKQTFGSIGSFLPELSLSNGFQYNAPSQANSSTTKNANFNRVAVLRFFSVAFYGQEAVVADSEFEICVGPQKSPCLGKVVLKGCPPDIYWY